MRAELFAFLTGFFTGLASPASEVQAAAADAIKLPAADARYVRYLTAYNLTPEQHADAVRVARFWVNSLSRARRLKFPVQVGPTLWRLDLRDYAWDIEAWDALTTDDPYFYAALLGPAEAVLRTATYASLAIVRLDFFLARTAYDPFYSRFLGYGKTVAELKRQFRVRDDDVEALRLQIASAVLSSTVSQQKNRQVEYRPTIAGAWWETRDGKTSANRQDVLDAQNLVKIDFDAQEFIFSLPNGLHAFALADAKGNLLAEADPKIVTDYITAFPRKDIRTGLSCVRCHDKGGLQPVEDCIAPLVRGGRYRVLDPEKDRVQQIEDLYLPGMVGKIAAGQLAYSAVVKACNGLETTANAILMEKVVYQYLEARVNLPTAARELGVLPTDPRLKLTTRGAVVALLAGQTIARDTWESAYGPTVKLLYSLQQETLKP